MANPWLNKLLANPVVSDLLAGRLPESVQHVVSDVRVALADFKPDLLVEGPLTPGEPLKAVGIYRGTVEEGGEIRGLNLLHGRVEGGALRTVNLVFADIHGGTISGFNAVIGAIHGGELGGGNLVAGDVHGGQLHRIHMVMGDVHGGEVHCNVLLGDVHGGRVRARRHEGTVHGGELVLEEPA